MPELRIRRAKVKDVDDVVLLLNELGYPNTNGLVRAKIKKLSRSSANVLLVAEIGHKTVAIGHLHIAELLHQPGRLGRIMAFVVAVEYQKLGIGIKLVGQLEKIAKKLGCLKMEVTSGIQRKGAHNFYKRLGYVEKPRRFIKMFSTIKRR